MTLLDLLAPSEIQQIMDNMPFLEPNDFQKAVKDLTMQEAYDYAYALNVKINQFISFMEARAEKLGGSLI